MDINLYLNQNILSLASFQLHHLVFILKIILMKKRFHTYFMHSVFRHQSRRFMALFLTLGFFIQQRGEMADFLG